MKKIILAVFSLAIFAGASAQTSLEEIKADPAKAGGVYYAYPAPAYSSTPAPEGFTPFYISHYGRHGSRYLISDNDYLRVIRTLHRADSAGTLTPLGQDVMRRADSVWTEAEGRGGELTPLGTRQHHDIAARMYKAFPEVFPDNAVITAASTPVMRCAHSMFAFIEGLKEQNPALRIPRESSPRHLIYLNYHSPESGPYASDKGEWHKDYVSFKAENTRPARLMASIFTDSADIDGEQFMTDLYWLAVDMQNMESTVSFMDLFTPEELYGLWQIYNFSFYATNSSYPGAKGLHVANASNLIRNIVENADRYIRDGLNGATLRFGHDGNIIPLAAFLRLENAYAEEADPHKLASVYSNFKISPMASNIQIVFYRNPAGEVLVKFLHNERETAIDLPADPFPYYRWDTVREHLLSRTADM